MWVDARILNGIASRHPNPVKKEEVEFFDYMDTNTRSGTPGKSADASAATDAEVASPDTLSKLAEMLTGNINVSELDGIKRTFYEINPLKSSISRPWELPEEDYKAEVDQLEQGIKSLERLYTHESEAPSNANSEITELYAVVTVFGRVVAEIDNQGAVTDHGGFSQEMFSNLPDGGKKGPDLAKLRADYIAQALHGSVSEVPTEISQDDFKNLGLGGKTGSRTHIGALYADPFYQTLKDELEQLRHMRSLYEQGMALE